MPKTNMQYQMYVHIYIYTHTTDKNLDELDASFDEAQHMYVYVYISILTDHAATSVCTNLASIILKQQYCQTASAWHK